MTLTTQTPYCVVEENSGIIDHQRTTYYSYSKCSSPNRKKNIGLINYWLRLPKHFVYTLCILSGLKYVLL